MKRGILTVFLALLLFLAIRPDSARAERARVLEVFDGDTIRVLLDDGTEETVRYLLIDTPELHHPRRGEEEMGHEAAKANRSLVGGKTVRLETDVLTRDRYGRLLAHVWVPTRKGEILASRWLVERGYALPFILPPNVRYEETIRHASRRARSLGAGLWGIAAPRLFSPAQAWGALETLQGHFITLEMTVAKVLHSGRRWLLLPEKGKCALILYDSDQPHFGHIPLFRGKALLVTGKLLAGFRGGEVSLKDPSQVRFSTPLSR